MNKDLLNILDIIQQSDTLQSEQKEMIRRSVKNLDKELTIVEFKLERSEKVKKTTAILLEETIEELEQKRKAVEEKNRELEIETALERVRSRTMGMQRSDELQDAAMLLFQQVEALGVPVFGCGFNIWDDDRKAATAWMAGNNRLQPPFKTSSSEDIFLRIHKAAEKGETLFVEEQTDKALKVHYEYMNSIPVFKEIADKMASMGQTFPTFQIMHCAFFSQGYLMFITHEPTPDAYAIFKRFAKVFEQTYTRFLDLEKAEAQAREAVKQASLDRVRGKIASMRTTEDLNRIIPIIWHELKTLEVPFIRCGVFIINEDRATVQIYLSKPDGQSLAALNLPIQFTPLTRQSVNNWRKGKLYKEHWNRDDFIQWMQSLIDMGKIQDKRTYQGATQPPKSLDLHFLPFTQGMLYVGNSVPLSDDDIELVKSLAEAFSVAYARYEDFKNLEEAKNKIELTLNELKAAQTQLIQAEKMASLGELTAGIAHEIQNPLNFVNNFSEVSTELLEEMTEEIEKGNLEEVKAITEDVIQNLERILHHGQRADGIVKGMLQHSRGSSGQKEPTDINTLADEYLRLSFHGLRARDKSFSADFKLEADESLPRINVVPQDIGRVLLNLISNAFYAVSEKEKLNQNGYKPMVVVITKKIGDSVEICVNDNGVGIPGEVKKKIFQPFFTTKPTGQGTGLGLSMSYDIVTKGHNGKLTVVTHHVENGHEESGTEFIISLPIN